MKTVQIGSKDWQEKFNLVSKKLDNRNIGIEINGLDIGHQIEAQSVHLKGLSYDPRDNVIQVISDDFEHAIRSPKEVFFTSNGENIESIESIEIIDDQDRKQIVTFEAALLLGH